MNFIEKEYLEDGIKITKLKTLGRPLSIRQGGYIDIVEIPVNKAPLSWKAANDIRLEKMKKRALVHKNK